MNAQEFFESFRGPAGICGQLAECAVAMAAGRTSSGDGSSIRPTGISDPTANAAFATMAMSKRYDALVAQIERAAAIAHAVEHGQVLDDYYLVEDGNRVTWTLLADEYGQTARTLMRWRDDACEEIDRRGLLWR